MSQNMNIQNHTRGPADGGTSARNSQNNANANSRRMTLRLRHNDFGATAAAGEAASIDYDCLMEWMTPSRTKTHPAHPLAEPEGDQSHVQRCYGDPGRGQPERGRFWSSTTSE